jgi:hypothetical protein
MSGVAFFVCGTPSNNRGFELVELGPAKLPGSPEAYLDKAPAAAECHRIESVIVDGERYVQYSRVLKINPNDAEANRGAYIAVGCLIRERLALGAVANCIDVVSELYGSVSSALTAERAFPADFRLADFTHVGSALDERAAHQCSPLLVADVVLQALNGEGPIDWPKTKEVLLAPGEMTSADVSRYQLYSRQGVLGSLASLDLERTQLHQTAQRATEAAQGLLELQREWAELEGAAERLLARGDAFKHLTFEIERNVQRDRALDARDGRAVGTQGAPTFEAAPLGSYGRAHYQGSAGFRIGAQRGRIGHDAARRRNLSQSHRGLPRRGWGRVALVLTGVFVAVITVYAVQRFRAYESAVASAPPSAVVESQPQDGEQERQQPENDVAAQRAALDALPNQ